MEDKTTWDLSSLFRSNDEWYSAVECYKPTLDKAKTFKGRLSQSPDILFNAFTYIEEEFKELERICSYAFLKYSADGSNEENANLFGVANALEAKVAEETSYFDSELVGLDHAYIEKALEEDRFRPYEVYIRHIRRQKAHILKDDEERLLSLFSPLSSAFQEAFNDLNNIDLSFESVNGKPLTHSLFSRYMISKDEEERKIAYKNYYKAFDNSKHLIAKLYEGSAKKDIFLSKARGYSSTLQRALYPDNIDERVYTSLIDAVHENIKSLHRYYEIRAKLMHKTKLKHYDVYVPMIDYKSEPIKYDEAVKIIDKALVPLGEEYRKTLISGLTDERWVDRYERKGKRSGAFSSGCYIGKPYILTNYEDNVLSSVFTLIHEGGHSMHSYYSTRSNPFLSYNYTIFEAEVASTFNENLLHSYMLDNAKSKEEEAYLISKHLDDIVATLFRQTMFAEFELKAHQAAEEGNPLTLELMRAMYRELQELYFGPIVELEDVSDLECLRIPHFYRAYYCYKYATGISASIALSLRVLNGGEKEKNDYLSFLSSGGSRYPLDSLKLAGVDMSQKEPVEKAIEYFDSLITRLEEIEL